MAKMSVLAQSVFWAQSARMAQSARVALLSLAILGSLGACSSDGTASTTNPPGAAQSSEAVATAVLDALASGNAEAAADHTIQNQMVWLAMAEGASLQEAANLLDQGAESVAINYWTGFTELGTIPPVAISSIAETVMGEHNFAVVSLGGNDDLRIVLRSDPEWKVDVVASFGSTLAARLKDVVAVVSANSGDIAARLREVLIEQRDSVEMAAADIGLNAAARDALVELSEALEDMAS
jgi:molybdopterin converting factor small subunit